jgi:hypothetical protein
MLSNLEPPPPGISYWERERKREREREREIKKHGQDWAQQLVMNK